MEKFQTTNRERCELLNGEGRERWKLQGRLSIRMGFWSTEKVKRHDIGEQGHETR